jgi:adenosylcobinamide-GDP ribazoletransferase
MGVLLLTVKSAKNEGLGALFQSAATIRVLWIYPIYFSVILGLMTFVDNGFILLSILSVMACASLLVCRRKAVSWFGGITGDVLGAAVEGTELLLWMTLWLLHYFAMA